MSVTNSERGVVALDIGGVTHTARLTFGALREAAEELGFEDGDSLMAAFGGGKGKTVWVLTVVAAALRRGSKPDATVAWLEEALSLPELGAVAEGFGRLTRASNTGSARLVPFGVPAPSPETPAGGLTGS